MQNHKMLAISLLLIAGSFQFIKGSHATVATTKGSITELKHDDLWKMIEDYKKKHAESFNGDDAWKKYLGRVYEDVGHGFSSTGALANLLIDIDVLKGLIKEFKQEKNTAMVNALEQAIKDKKYHYDYVKTINRDVGPSY